MSGPDRRRVANALPPASASGGLLSSVLLVVLVLVTGAGLVLAGSANAPYSPRPRVEDLTNPTQRQLVCPSSRGATTTYAGLLPGSPGSVSVDGTPVPIPPSGVAKMSAVGGSSLTLVATGRATRGLFATRTRTGGGVSICAAARASWWFVGAGASPAHFGQLELVNPRPGPAVVDVTVYGPDGLVESAGLRGVTVRSGETRTLRLARVAPKAGNLALHVEASRGLVVADVDDHVLDVVDPKAKPASEWIPSQAVPGRHLALSGIPKPGGAGGGVTDLSTATPSSTPSGAPSGSPSGVPTGAPSPTESPASTRSASRRPRVKAPTGVGGPTLVITNPGQSETVASVRLSGPSGSFSPKGVAPQTIPPESTVSVRLDGILTGSGTTIRVDGDRPLLAGYLVPGKSDLVHAVPAVPWVGPAAVALPANGRRVLVLSAADSAESVTVTQYAPSGTRVSRAQVDVPARSTVTTGLDASARSVVVTSADGRVVGSVLVVRASGSSALPLTPVLAALRVPVVRPAAQSDYSSAG